MRELRTSIPNAKAGVDYTQVVGYEKIICGVDLGSLRDPTAIAIVRDTLRPAPRWGKGYKQLFEPRKLELCQLLRLRVGIDWTDVGDFIRKLHQTEELNDARFVLDATGVGRPAIAMVKERGVPVTSVTITPGDNFSEVARDEYRCSKLFLLTNFATVLQSGEMKIATAMNDVREFKTQIANFAAQYTPAGNLTVNAAKGHDDLLLAASLATFGATSIKQHKVWVSEISW